MKRVRSRALLLGRRAEDLASGFGAGASCGQRSRWKCLGSPASPCRAVRREEKGNPRRAAGGVGDVTGSSDVPLLPPLRAAIGHAPGAPAHSAPGRAASLGWGLQRGSRCRDSGAAPGCSRQRCASAQPGECRSAGIVSPGQRAAIAVRAPAHTGRAAGKPSLGLESEGVSCC